MSLKIINSHFKNYEINNSGISDILNLILKNENKKIENLNIIIENDHFLKVLKKKYFNQNVYTDVITFNLEEDNQPIDGEIYVSLPRIIENAKAYNSKFEEEFKRIIIHGFLHLVGYNDIDKNQKNKMTELEDYYITLNSKNFIKVL